MKQTFVRWLSILIVVCLSLGLAPAAVMEEGIVVSEEAAEDATNYSVEVVVTEPSAEDIDSELDEDITIEEVDEVISEEQNVDLDDLDSIFLGSDSNEESGNDTSELQYIETENYNASYMSEASGFSFSSSSTYSNPLLDYGMYKTSGFYPRRSISLSSGAHLACDYNDGHTHSNVYPIFSGDVVDVNYNSGSGNYVLLSHTAEDGTKFYSQYQHLDTVYVGKGQHVDKGVTVLAHKGNTGVGSNGVPYSEHLHLIVFSITQGSNFNQWPLPQEIFDSNPGISQEVNVEYTATPYLDVYIPRWGGNYMRFYNPEKLLSGEYTIGSSSSAAKDSSGSSNTSTTTYEVITSDGLNVRSSPDTSSSSNIITTIWPGTTIAVSETRTVSGITWGYGTTSTGVTGWLSLNSSFVKLISSSTTGNQDTTSTPSISIKNVTVKKNMKWKVGINRYYQINLSGVTAKSYTTSNKKVATVSSTGLVNTKSVGSAKVTIRLTNNKKITIKITTYDPTIPTKVTLNKKGTITVQKGQTQTLTATMNSGAVSNINWSTSNKKVATVNNGVVTFLKKGTAVITATTVRGKKKAKVKFKVSK